MKKSWKYEQQDEAEVKRISEKFKISELLAKVLINKKLGTDEDIVDFLNPDISKIYNPYLINDMDKAVDRILAAVDKNEKILIYGDYDVDGITSITVLKKFLYDLGNEAYTYLPNRLDEGYGLNKTALDEISKDGINLIITVDCGISALEEVDYANSKGFDVIVTDHHECGEVLPNAIAVINPKRNDSKYPFKQLAGVGVTLKLIQAMSIKKEFSQEAYLKYLDIVCIGTIADIVPLVGENRIIAKNGLDKFKNTTNIGMKALLKRCGYQKIDSTAISFGLSPRINACGRIGNPQKALDLFLADNEEKAMMLANELNEANIKRQEIEREIYEDAKNIIETTGANNDPIIILAKDNWHHGVIGIVASKLVEKYGKPCILVCFEGEEGKSSGRSFPNFDLFTAVSSVSDLLERYGGHEMAIGLTIKKANYNEFKEKLIKYTKEHMDGDFVNIIKIDAEVAQQDVNIDVLKELSCLEPYGEKNSMPLFIYKGLKISAIRTLSNDKHLKLELKDNQTIYDAIGFNLGKYKEVYKCGDKVDVVFYLEINKYNDIEKIQFNVKDIMKSV